MKIYQTFIPTPSRVLGLIQLVEAAGDQPLCQRDVVDLMVPSTVHEGSGVEANNVRAIIDAAIEAGFVESDGDDAEGTLQLSAALRSACGSGLRRELPRLAAALVLRPELDGRPNRFAEICAWMMAQPVRGMPLGHNRFREELESAGFSLDKDELNLKNEARVDMVMYWAKYLGLMRQLQPEQCQGLVPDPTAFLLRHLDKLLPPGSEMTGQTFVKSVGKLCPVLDGGVVRQRVLEQMTKAGKPAWPADHLSEALSFALQRLRRRGIMEYWCPDDQRTFLLTNAHVKVAFIRRTQKETP